MLGYLSLAQNPNVHRTDLSRMLTFYVDWCHHENVYPCAISARPSGLFLTAMICMDCYILFDLEPLPTWLTPIFLGPEIHNDVT